MRVLKWLKRWVTSPTLILCTIISFIGAFLIWVVVISIGGYVPRGYHVEYLADAERIELAVAEYMTWQHLICEDSPQHWGCQWGLTTSNTSINVTGENVSAGDKYYIVAICPMLTSSFPKGILNEVPSSCAVANCEHKGANAVYNVTTCLNQCTGSYVWLTTINGEVASICIGAECEAHGEDGYQGVYP